MAKNTDKRWAIGAAVIVAAVAVTFAIRAGKAKKGDIATYGIPQVSIPAQPPALPAPGAVVIDETTDLAALGDQYFDSRRYMEAIEIYRKAIERNPQDADTHNDLGLALFYTGRKDEAIDILRKAVKVDPVYQLSWLSLGFTLNSVGKPDEANEAFKKTIQLNPSSAQGIEAKRMLFENLSRPAKK